MRFCASIGHTNNPAWLPHAKLHCAMSFFAAVSLGGAALAVLQARPVTDRFSMGLAAFLGSAFWVGLIAAGFWSGTSYGFLNDPVLGNTPEPKLFGITIYLNVVASVITIAIAVVGYWLTRQAKSAVDPISKKVLLSSKLGEKMTQKLDGKVAVVTGAPFGIGEAMSGDKQLFASLHFVNASTQYFSVKK